MTHQAHPSVMREVVQVLAAHGFDGMAQAMELLITECMKIERQHALGVGPWPLDERERMVGAGWIGGSLLMPLTPGVCPAGYFDDLPAGVNPVLAAIRIRLEIASKIFEKGACSIPGAASHRAVARVEQALNERPRRRLGYRTLAEILASRLCCNRFLTSPH